MELKYYYLLHSALWFLIAFHILIIGLLVVALPWHWPEGSHDDPRLKAEGNHGYPNVNTHITLQATINLFIYGFLDLTLIPWFNQAIIGFTRPLWTLLGHYGFYYTIISQPFMGCASSVK